MNAFFRTGIAAIGLAALAPVVSISPAAAQPNAVAGQANFGQLISALNNINAQIQNLNALNNLTVSQVRVVNVSDLLNGNNVNALNNALNNNHTNIQVLQNLLNSSLNNNNVLNGANIIDNVLNHNNIPISHVVAIDVLSGGVTVFQNPTFTL